MCLLDVIYLKSAHRDVPWLEHEVGIAQRLLVEVIQATLVVPESVFPAAIRKLPVQVEQTVLLVIERHPVRLSEASRAEAGSPFESLWAVGSDQSRTHRPGTPRAATEGMLSPTTISTPHSGIIGKTAASRCLTGND